MSHNWDREHITQQYMKLIPFMAQDYKQIHNKDKKSIDASFMMKFFA